MNRQEQLLEAIVKPYLRRNQMSKQREELVEIIGEYIGHYDCEEDNWYGCPLSESGCSDESKGNECTCGRDEKVSKLADKILESYVSKEACDEIISLAEKMSEMRDKYIPKSEMDWVVGELQEIKRMCYIMSEVSGMNNIDKLLEEIKRRQE